MNESTNYIIRPLQAGENHLLRNFLYEAIYIPEGAEPPSKDVVELPELKVYIENFGKKKDDYCLVAETDGKVVGAAWVRIMNDYGHVDDETPSLSISLYKEYRNKGIGSRLMQEIIKLLVPRPSAMRIKRTWNPIVPLLGLYAINPLQLAGINLFQICLVSYSQVTFLFLLRINLILVLTFAEKNTIFHILVF